MNAMGNSKNVLYLAVIFVLLIVLAVVYWIQPNLAELETYTNQLEQTQSQMNQLQSQLNQQSSDPNIDQIRLAALLKKIPESSRTDELMFETRGLELISGFQFPGYFWSEDPPLLVNVSDTKGRNLQVMLTPQTITQTFKTTFGKLSTYLKEIDEMTRVMRVRELSISAPSSNPIQIGQTNRELNVNMVLETFYAPDLKTWVQTEAGSDKLSKPFYIKKQPFE